MLLIVTCTSCKADVSYLVSSYLNDLSIKSGIGINNNIEENFQLLKNWGVINEDDQNNLNDQLDLDYLVRTITNLLNEEDSYLLDNEWIISNKNRNIYKDEANTLIEKAVKVINNKSFDNEYKYEFKNEIVDETIAEIGDLVYDQDCEKYKILTEEGYRDAEFEEIFSKMELSNSQELDFSNAEVIPYEDEPYEVAYTNDKYNLLASNNHVFNKNGFRISYSLNGSGINVHISKNVDSINLYGDVSINNVKPSFKWSYKDGDIKNCYFNLKMNTTEKIGASYGKYGKYYLKLKDLDSSSFKTLLDSMIIPKRDEVEAIIPICEIKTPIPNIPTAYLNMTLIIKLYVSGKAEVILYNKHNMGFETKDGNIRFISDHTNDIDSIIGASAKAALGINASIDAASFRIFDIEMDGGLKAEVKSTMHLYDEEGNVNKQASDIAYSTLSEVSKENEDVKICGDLSLYWMLDLIVNTYKTVMYKMGFTKTFHILDDNNQVFNNKHHIENGMFVDKCTRVSKSKIKESQGINAANKIVLDSYAEVINIGDSYEIKILILPTGYDESKLVYKSENEAIATVSGKTIKALKPGPVKIKVSTNDDKYSSYINILVSTG